ncbi:hypothetical protein J6590_101366 [Homalodisca vitripennis]|nr:hypothetical protein J6590_101366 [Homalodisca vitripennis]
MTLLSDTRESRMVDAIGSLLASLALIKLVENRFLSRGFYSIRHYKTSSLSFEQCLKTTLPVLHDASCSGQCYRAIGLEFFTFSLYYCPYEQIIFSTDQHHPPSSISARNGGQQRTTPLLASRTSADAISHFEDLITRTRQDQFSCIL